MYKNAYHKRKATMRNILLFDNIFQVPVDKHHISDAFIIYIPRDIHMRYLGIDHRKNLKPIIEELYQISYYIVENGEIIESWDDETIDNAHIMKDKTSELQKLMSKRKNQIVVSKRVKNKYSKTDFGEGERT